MAMEFLELEQPVIIATKGLPCTSKSEFARIIGWWARCPVLYIDHFLDALSLENGYTADLLLSLEQAERLHRLSFDALCKVASVTLQWGVEDFYKRYKCVVVKSRLCSTFEVDRLLELAKGLGCGMILIIEFQMKNKYRFRLRLEHKVESRRQKEWYKPRSCKDIENAKDDYDANIWDLHLRRLLNNGDDLPWVARLVLDVFDDLYLVPFPSLPRNCQCIINCLLNRVAVGNGGDWNIGDRLFLQGRYAVVQYGEVGRYLREEDLRGPRSRRDLCYSNNAICIFKYWEKLNLDDDEGKPYYCYCGVCEERVISGHPAYGCHFCSLALHKSCVELPANNAHLEGFRDIETLRLYPKRLSQGHACKSCLERGKDFSRGCHSCSVQTHLKCCVLPTILYHDCHEHFLFMHFDSVHKHVELIIVDLKARIDAISVIRFMT